MAFAQAADLTIKYNLSGPEDAPVVMLSHSIGTSGILWEALTAQLAKDYRVLTYDIRGHGLSGVTPGPYSMDLLADDCIALLDTLDIHYVHFCGVSLGGMIGQQLAAMSPARIASVTLCDTATRIGTAASWHERAAKTRAEGMAPLADSVLERWFVDGFAQRRPADWNGYRNMFCRTPPEGYAASCEAIAEADLGKLSASIKCRALVLVGAEDRSTPLEKANHLADTIPDARVRVIDGSAHLPPVEKPSAVAQMLKDFYQK